ncbi:MAG: glycosyltransferase family 1 protein [Pseudomonadota bacterium]
MSRPLILFDLTRLLSATGRSAPTGIERVEAKYAQWLLSLADIDVEFVATFSSAIRLVQRPSVRSFLERQAKTWGEGAEDFSAHTALSNINQFLAGEDAPRAPRFSHLSPEERRERQRAREAGRPAQAITSWAQKVAASLAHDPLGPVLRRASRQPIIYLRASNDRLENSAPFERLKAMGVKMVVITYDTIPLDYPEFVRPKAAALCEQRIRNMARLAEGIIAISHYSASRLKPLLAPYKPKLTVAHLGADLPDHSRSLPSLVEAPFFLMVSTIEARKNHQLLLNIWRRMVDELGEKTPKLVLAGKRGWEAQNALAILDRAEELRPFVFEAGAVPDEALDLLRRRATALLMPSFVEGFGLPVTEALGVGTPVIASDISVFREVAGDACEFIDPLDGTGWRQAVCDFAAPRSRRREDAIARAKAFQAPSWSGHFARVRTLLDDIAAHAPVSIASRARRVLGSAALIARSTSPVAAEGTTNRRPA